MRPQLRSIAGPEKSFFCGWLGVVTAGFVANADQENSRYEHSLSDQLPWSRRIDPMGSKTPHTALHVFATTPLCGIPILVNRRIDMALQLSQLTVRAGWSILHG